MKNNQIRIGICGQVDTGKSTLLGVLTNPKNLKEIKELDNGRGSARSIIFKHKHEKETGRTSSVTNCYANYGNNDIIFIDLAGHEKYLGTTMTGISGGVLDYIIVLLSANTPTVPRITKEHIGLSLAFKIPIIFVITKIDMPVEDQKKILLNKLNKLMESEGAGNKEINYMNQNTDIEQSINMISTNENMCPLFQISNTTGENINLLQKFISQIKPNLSWQNKINDEPLFFIEAVFHITGIGIVISGTLKKGILKNNDNLLLGPYNGNYKSIVIKNIHDTQKNNINILNPGQTGSLWIKSTNFKEKLFRNQIKRGMVMIKQKECTREFNANITILHNHTTIKVNYQPVIHCGNIKQAARICEIKDIKTNNDKEYLRAGDKANIKFKFLFHPEFIENNSVLVFREGKTKGIGKIILNK
jgi:small GTP-binding protein